MTTTQDNPGSERSYTLQRRQKVNHFFSTVRRCTSIMTGLIIFGFAWVKLKALPIVTFLENAEPSLVLQIALAIGFGAWLRAISYDLSTHEAVFVDDPDQGKMTASFMAGMLVMAAVGALLLWASSNERIFSIAFFIYLLGNILFWRLILKRAKAMMEGSRAFYGSNDLFDLEKIDVLENYADGQWQWNRFFTLIVLALLLIVITNVGPVRGTMTFAIHWIFPNLVPAVISSFLPVVVFIISAVAADTWMWLMRFKARESIRVIDDLQKRYRIARIDGR
jgi:hypothetical protein